MYVNYFWEQEFLQKHVVEYLSAANPFLPINTERLMSIISETEAFRGLIKLSTSKRPRATGGGSTRLMRKYIQVRVKERTANCCYKALESCWFIFEAYVLYRSVSSTISDLMISSMTSSRVTMPITS